MEDNIICGCHCATKPSQGLHLTVTKNNEIIDKLSIDQKNCYFFGRDCNQCDFILTHDSCSRLHASLSYHKHLNLFYLMDLGSSHGTWIGDNLKIEQNRPTPINIGSNFHFGYSTRIYTICKEEENEIMENEIIENEPDIDIDALTNLNTQFNKNLFTNSNTNSNIIKMAKRKNVQFVEPEEIMNDDSLTGRFKNLVQSIVIPTKKIRLDPDSNNNDLKVFSPITSTNINPAPDVEMEENII
ncbi:hypothetical protein PVAND_002844 [Polypedilum vanderplanki]|uniref:FHA domain-containing protein n=1 Tax=Polypedilum vanderplanki TaxID=319348 RepID=A0A9J6BSQ7_POLVA|nr:hypothetical protein PVAND_002844 [Polypedilum vanderplanki]